MKRTAYSLVVLAVFAACVAAGQRTAVADGELNVQVVSVDDAAFPDMTLVVAVEAAGRPVASLEPAEITVSDNGEAATVSSVRRIQDASIPTTVVVALDTSGSMAGANIVRAKEALAGLVSGLSASDRVGLVSFSDRPVVVAAPGSATAVVQAVAGLQAAGNTALYGAVAESARVASAAGDARRLVILLTDGEEYGNVSGLTRDASLEQAVASGAIFYVIGLGVGADRDYLNELASRTGGRYLDAPTTADVDRGYAAIEETLRGQFVVTVRSSAPPEPLARSVGVRVTQAAGSGVAKLDFTSTRSLPEPVVEPTQAPAVVTAPPVAEQEPKEQQGGSSFWIVGVLVFVAVAGLAFWGWRRRGREPVIPLEPPADAGPLLEPAVAEPQQQPTVARLVRRAASNGGAPDDFRIGLAPASVGWSPDCQVRLPRADGLSAVHARLWWRDGSLMLHDLSGGATRVNGAPARWASLADSDRLEFGPFSFEVIVTEPATATAQA